MKKVLIVSLVVFMASLSQAYLIQDVDLDVDYWTGSGANECVIAIDWNSTGGTYASQFHIFGYRWDGDKTVADALIALDTDLTEFQVTTLYGGGFIDDIIYDQSLIDGDNHTAGDYTGWWWTGETQDGGQTWLDNSLGIDAEYLWNGGIEAINVDGSNWGSANMTIPEPATMMLLAIGFSMTRRRK